MGTGAVRVKLQPGQRDWQPCSYHSCNWPLSFLLKETVRACTSAVNTWFSAHCCFAVSSASFVPRPPTPSSMFLLSFFLLPPCFLPAHECLRGPCGSSLDGGAVSFFSFSFSSYFTHTGQTPVTSCDLPGASL